ncbi:hypothetical protein [Frigoribacterium sp. Leaf172]|uniref:hypothetical protein n=1 Tax=Frigoribacterium sp. Leaf172 TaxID=1736285 RepID=UPI0012E7D75C|nr:hypothetical protein [Frigoribacterium sp. Leaf172]
MRTTTLHIDGQSFFLDPELDTTSLRAEILAGSANAAFVEFSALGRGEVSVLVSPRTSARFEIADIQLDFGDDDPEHGDGDAPAQG